MPPGPWGLPFIGVGLKVNADAPHLTFTEWNKKYGDIASFTIFGTKFVTIRSDTALREAFVNKQDQISGKFTIHVNQNRTKKKQKPKKLQLGRF